ncbi:MAG TPA: FAD-dependent oxidoreductase [Longimicrobiales bacterium]
MADRQVDVAVVGAGPAGMAAAICAAEQGKRVVVLDESGRAGGQIWRHRETATLPGSARRWLQRFEASGAAFLSGATVFDIVERAIRAEQNGAPLHVHAENIVLCVGARERFLPFPGWTLPGVVGAGGGQALLKQGMQVAGKRVVIAGSGPLLFPVAATFAKHGAVIQLVAEQVSQRQLLAFAAGLWHAPVKWLEAARYRAGFAGARFATGTWITRALGNEFVSEVEYTDGTSLRRLPCDLLCVGYGLVPANELARLAGCAVDDSGRVTVDDFQQTTRPGIYCAGETTGVAGVDAALVEGRIAGYAAAGAVDRARGLLARRNAQRRFMRSLHEAFALRAELRGLATAETVVCRCEDVRMEELHEHASMRAAKLQTRAGMGPCQGRICGTALQHMFGWGADTVRVPVAAVNAGTLAGE